MAFVLELPRRFDRRSPVTDGDRRGAVHKCTDAGKGGRKFSFILIFRSSWTGLAGYRLAAQVLLSVADPIANWTSSESSEARENIRRKFSRRFAPVFSTVRGYSCRDWRKERAYRSR